MATGPEHYAAAERLLALAMGDAETSEQVHVIYRESPRWLAAAAVHAELAKVAALVDTSGGTRAHDEWREAIG